MIDLFSRGRLIAGFPVGTAMDTCYSYGVNPSQLRPKYYEGVELIRQAWTSHRTVRVQRRVQQASLRQPGAPPVPAAAPADLDPRRRLDRDVGLLRRERLRLRRPHVLRRQDGPRDRRRVLEPGRGARQGLQPEPPRRHPVHRCRRHRRRGLPSCTRSRPSTSSTARCTSTPASPIRPATSPRHRCEPATRRRSVRPRERSRPSTT